MGPSTFDIRLGDALPLTQELDDSYVDAIITSTPWPGRKGGPHPDEFVAWFLPFAIEFKRVLKPTGSMVLNIKEPVKGGERSTCVLSLILALAAMGWRWLDEYPGLTPSPFPSAGPCRTQEWIRTQSAFHKGVAMLLLPKSSSHTDRRLDQARAPT